VEIFWNAIHHSELEEYKVYSSSSADGTYHLLGHSQDCHFIDDDVINGETYYYAVSACDIDGGETELSYETVHDTPRPEGWGLHIQDDDNYAGVDFSDYNYGLIQPWDAPRTDMFLLWYDGHYCMASGADVPLGDEYFGIDIQYGGYVTSLDELNWAPEYGWSTAQSDTVRLYEGHAYHVWTWDDHFAKFRVEHVGYDYVVIDWAYQIDEGNPELSVIMGRDAAEEGRSPVQQPLVKNGRSVANRNLDARRSSRLDAGTR
jgi:hypothetical protein